MQGNLQHVSIDFLGNHEKPTPMRFYIQGKIHHVPTEFLRHHQDRTRVKFYSQVIVLGIHGSGV